MKGAAAPCARTSSPPTSRRMSRSGASTYFRRARMKSHSSRSNPIMRVPVISRSLDGRRPRSLARDQQGRQRSGDPGAIERVAELIQMHIVVIDPALDLGPHGLGEVEQAESAAGQVRADLRIQLIGVAEEFVLVR